MTDNSNTIDGKADGVKQKTVLYIVFGMFVIVILGLLGYVIYSVYQRKSVDNDLDSVPKDEVDEDNADDLTDEINEIENDFGDTQSISDTEGSIYDISSWETYTNEEMGFKFKYPSNPDASNATDYVVVVMERYHEDLGKVNCVDIGPVDGESKAYIAIGYDPIEGYPNGCFRSGVGAGEQYVEDIQLRIGDKMVSGKKLIYVGDGYEQAYTSRIFHLDNPNMDSSRYSYFGVEVEYYPEYEDRYWGIYQEILESFEWL